MSGHLRLRCFAFRKLFLPCVVLALVFQGITFAGIFGTVRGIVHDPQHRPVPNLQIVLKAKSSEFMQTTQTDANGAFHFDAVPLAEYTVTVSNPGFATIEQTVTVLSGTAPVLHFELQLASQNQSIVVAAASAVPATPQPATPQPDASQSKEGQ